jgi:hypothetical protein
VQWGFAEAVLRERPAPSSPNFAEIDSQVRTIMNRITWIRSREVYAATIRYSLPLRGKRRGTPDALRSRVGQLGRSMPGIEPY